VLRCRATHLCELSVKTTTAAAAVAAAATTGFNVERCHACVRLLRTARAFFVAAYELFELAAAAG